jgi:organic radical activating enzyme
MGAARRATVRPQAAGATPQRLRPAQVEPAIRSRDLQVLNLTLSGGEPLVHPDFFLLGSRARELGSVVRVKSNGHALRGAALRRLRDEVGSCAWSSPGKSRTPMPREALLLSEPVLVVTASVLSSGSTRPAA